MDANVGEIFELPNTATQLLNLQQATESTCAEARNESEEFLDETRREEQHSLQLLNAAREIEEAAHAAMIVAEGILLAAEARLAAIPFEAASLNPLALEEFFAAQEAYHQAREAYDAARAAYEAAKAHRELLDGRYEMARQAVNLAELMNGKLEMYCLKCTAQIIPLVEQGVARIMQAHSDLEKYHAENSDAPNLPAVRISTHKPFEEWTNYQPSTDKPVKPDELKARLNPSDEILQSLLERRYQNDSKFRAQMDSYREQAKIDRSAVEQKLKKNMSGGLAEEIVKHALKPYGGVYRTQERVYLPDGTFTKPDFILHDLKVPLIVGKGSGMGVREAKTIAVEVKAGQSNYLLSQREHLETQAQGHAHCDASWTICTRDIRDIDTPRQKDFREAIRSAGSPIIGYLPRKDDLDAACMKFVFGGST